MPNPHAGTDDGAADPAIPDDSAARNDHDLDGASPDLDSLSQDEAAQASTALLGELTAGIAHEMTNPVAAIRSALDHLAHDLDDLLASFAEGTADADVRARAGDARRRISSARDRTLRSSADARALRRAITGEVGDDVLARRLVAAGAEDPADAADLAAGGEPAIERARHATAVGDALRHLDAASRQVGALVSSIRAHVRPLPPGDEVQATTGTEPPTAEGADETSTHDARADADPRQSVVVADSLRSALTLTEHRRRGLGCDLSLGDVPPVRAEPGHLDQVWTNVLVNAADAMGGSGTLTIDLTQTDDGLVRVVLANDGPPIPAGDLDRIFTRRFTTRSGGRGGGLGLGLALSKDIVERAGGTMHARSREGLTEMIVELPPDPGAHVAASAAGRETR
ncbi:sensor histidine kinase [Georgenia sp. Z1491]|uniref:sensor histidine kinase n=1 Tax=Georgenia sp. Z1491 TaxID=3416707 RepID=UPI003CE9FE75